MKKLYLTVITLVGATPSHLLGLDIDGHSAGANDRFANSPTTFIGESYDWSGVGRSTTGSTGGGGHWATMISSNVFISANHAHPPTGTSLYFYPDNDPAASPIVRTITAGQRVGTSDLWVGTIDQTLPSSISCYNWASQNVSTATFALSMLADENALLTGISTTSGGYAADKRTSMSVGRNVIEGYIANLEVDGTTGNSIYTIQNQLGDSNYVTHESQLVGGDSGGPLFIDDGGELLLVGINWAVGSIDTNPSPFFVNNEDASFYTYTGNYSADIQSYINANEPAAVPEPSAVMSMLSGAILLLLKRRR